MQFTKLGPGWGYTHHLFSSTCRYQHCGKLAPLLRAPWSHHCCEPSRNQPASRTPTYLQAPLSIWQLLIEALYPRPISILHSHLFCFLVGRLSTIFCRPLRLHLYVGIKSTSATCSFIHTYLSPHSTAVVSRRRPASIDSVHRYKLSILVGAGFKGLSETGGERTPAPARCS